MAATWAKAAYTFASSRHHITLELDASWQPVFLDYDCPAQIHRINSALWASHAIDCDDH